MRIPRSVLQPFISADGGASAGGPSVAAVGERLSVGREVSAMAMARGARLARGGRYEHALRALKPLFAGGDRRTASCEALHLRARIYAQQGRLLDAEADWIAAVAADQGTRQYRLGLDTLQSLRWRVAPVVIAAATLIAAIAFAVGYFVRGA